MEASFVKFFLQILEGISFPHVSIVFRFKSQPSPDRIQDQTFFRMWNGNIERAIKRLFDIVTDPRLGGRGYGTKLISGLPGWALENGGRHAYLQVVEANEPARHICARLGFDEAYRYWYRVPSSP